MENQTLKIEKTSNKQKPKLNSENLTWGKYLICLFFILHYIAIQQLQSLHFVEYSTGYINVAKWAFYGSISIIMGINTMVELADLAIQVFIKKVSSKELQLQLLDKEIEVKKKLLALKKLEKEAEAE